MSEHKIPIPSMIYNAAVGGHVTNSQQVIDENENKEQSQINAEVKQTLGQGGSVNTRINQAKNDIIGGASSNGNTLKKLEDRVSPIESAVSTGGNIDTRIKEAVNIEKTRAEEKESTLNNKINIEKNRAEKAEENLDIKIDTLETIVGQGDSINSRISNAVAKETTRAQNVESTLQTNINVEITRAQTAEEQLRTLYNNLQQSQPIPVTKLPVTGEAGKIYRLAGTTSYSDYMWNGTQFVKMATYNNAIDNEPTVGSDNLVKSGGINNTILKSIIHNEKKENYYAKGKYLVTSSGIKESSTLFYSYEYLVSNGDVVIVKYASAFSTPDYSAVSLWNDNTFVQDVLATPTVGDKYIYLQIPSGVNRLIVSVNGDVYKPILPIIDQLSQNYIIEKGYIPKWYSRNILIFDDGHTISSTFETISYAVKEGEEYELNISTNISDELSYASLWNNNTGTFIKSIASAPLTLPVSIQFTIPNGINELCVIAMDGVELKKIYRKKHISALFIGNSVNQDHITYLPWLLKNTYPDIDFEIYIAYKGSYTIKALVENIINGTEKISVFSYARNTDVWTNLEEVSFDDMFKFSVFDIVSFQDYINPGPYVKDTSYYKILVDYIRTKQKSPLKFGYLLHQTYNHNDGTYSWTESKIWEDIVNAAKQALLTTPVDMVFACGGASKLVESSFGTSFLTPDTIHNNEGLPCIMGAYVIMEKLSSFLGLKSGVLNNPLRITQSIYERLHISGINGSLKIGTESQYKEAQEAAINAVKFGDSLVANTCIDLL